MINNNQKSIKKLHEKFTGSNCRGQGLKKYTISVFNSHGEFSSTFFCSIKKNHGLTNKILLRIVL